MNAPMTREEIREIRTALGLTQVEAGSILGGGPRAFAKYEAGTVEPSAGLVKLLRLLDRDPSALASVGGRHRRNNRPFAAAPFTATGDDVMRLHEWELPHLLRLLLHAEAEANGLPTDGIHVAEDYFVADGGEDAHIRWEEGPDRTPDLPARHTQFQLKTGHVTPGKAASEVVASDGRTKPAVRDALDAGAHYVFLCTTSMTAKKAAAIADAVRTSLNLAGSPVRPERIHIRDADQLAAWTSRYPAVVARLKECSGSNTTGPFQSWIQWGSRSEIALSPLVDDERLPDLRARLAMALHSPGTVMRVLGPAGVGKSRLVHESLCSVGEDGLPIDEFVLYADQSESEETATCGAVRALADGEARAIVIVDDCPPDTHQRLAGMVAAPRSRLSLVTIDNVEHLSAIAHDRSTATVENAPPTVTETIIDRDLPGLPSEDRRRLVLFSRGFPAIAVRVATAWAHNNPMPYATDDHFVDAFVVGRNDPEPDIAIRTAMLIAAFGTVRHTPECSHIDDLANWGRRITPRDMHAALGRLIDRGVVQRRGGLVVLQPRPVAMRLTERQWREWMPNEQLALLSGDLHPDFKRNAARQLAWINDTDVAKEVAETVLAPGGPLDGLDRLSLPGNASVLKHLAEVDAQRAVDSILRTVDDVGDLRSLSHDVRRHLVDTLEMIAFRQDTFADAAALLLRLAVDETEHGISNNATGQFAALFPLIEGATAADGSDRIAFLREAANTNHQRQRAVVVDAFLAGASMRSSRFIGAETHGSRPALKPWRPTTTEEAAKYVTFCVESLSRQATALDEIADVAKGGLARELRALVKAGLIEVVEKVVRHLHTVAGSWPGAIESLGHFIEFDAGTAPRGTADRARRLIDLLQPTNLAERIHDLVSNMPWDYPNGEALDYDEQVQRQLDTVRGIAEDALDEAMVLARQIPELSSGPQRWAGAFGEFMGERIDAPEEWLHEIAAAVSRTAPDRRNFDLLAGFIKALSGRNARAVDSFKQQIARSAELSPALPAICVRIGLVETDVHLVVEALRAEVLPPSSLKRWAVGDALGGLPSRALAPLFDRLLACGDEGLDVAVELIGMLAHGAETRLESLRPQLLTLAATLADSDLGQRNTMAAHHVETMLRWLLSKDRYDADACALALTLARTLAANEPRENTIDLLSPLLPDLLSRFPEIAWPLIGQQLLRPTASAWELGEAIAGERAPHRADQSAPILSLAPEVLFAWCSANVDEAPACAAGIVPTLGPVDEATGQASLHPLFVRLLEQFGDREDVLEAATANIHSFSWVGSLTTYFARFLTPLAALRDHQVPRVARWANRTILHLERAIERARAHDDERQAGFEV